LDYLKVIDSSASAEATLVGIGRGHDSDLQSLVIAVGLRVAAKGGGSVASCRREGSLSKGTGADGVLTTRRGRKEGELDQSMARNQVNGYGDFDMSLGSSRIALHKVKL
jgi:hypothetical protein